MDRHFATKQGMELFGVSEKSGYAPDWKWIFNPVHWHFVNLNLVTRQPAGHTNLRRRGGMRRIAEVK